jgi:hypothetical protein
MTASNQNLSFGSRETDWPFKFADIRVTAIGDTTIVAATEGSTVRVVAVYLVANIAGTIVFQDGIAGTNLTGIISLPATGGFALQYCPVGWFETQTVNTLLNASVATSTAVSGGIVYQIIEPDIT